MTNTDFLNAASFDACKASKSAPVELSPDLARNRLLDSSKAATLLGYSVPHFRRLCRAKVVPTAVRINGRKMGWPVGVLLDFIASRVGGSA